MLDVKTYFKRHIKCRYIFVKELSKIVGRKVIQRIYDSEGKLVSKECSCCHEIKPISEFNKHKIAIDGLRPRCKECLKKYRQDNAESIREYKKQYRKDNAKSIREYHKQYRKDNAEKIKEHRKENAESIKKYQKKYRKDNAENIKEYHKQYQKDNSEKIKEYQKQYYIDNSESIKERRKQYQKENAEKIKEYKKQYRKDNVESIKEYNKEYKKEYNTKKVQQALQQIKTEVEADPNKYNYTKNKEIYGIIYLVHNVKANRYYVRQTTIGFDNRYPSGWLYEHGRKNSVKHDLQLYGKESFKFTKLFKVAHSQYELDKLEAYYIDYYNSYENGYNENRGNIFTDRGKEI